MGTRLASHPELKIGSFASFFLGEFVQGHRDQVVVVTKYSSAVSGKDPYRPETIGRA
jgi:hypothetical protein